jgi:arylformamidase
MRIYDISLPISEAMVVWPGQSSVQITKESELVRGDTANVSRLALTVHTGTHLDATKHFLKDGTGVEMLDLNVLVGPALVVEALDVDMITADVLDTLNIPPGTLRVLFHTRNSKIWSQPEQIFRKDFVAVDESGARWLVDHGVKLVGVDYLSVAPFTAPTPCHVVLLSAKVIPVEGLNLEGIEAGEYQLCCLPINIAGCDGAPARAILMR